MRLKDLKPAEYNPRRDLQRGDPEYDKLRRSIETFGCVEPIIWNEQTQRVLGGHQRLKVLLDLGVTEEKVVVVDLAPDSEKSLNVALNKISGDWDMSKLKDLLEELDAGELDLTITGFDMAEIESIMTQFAPDECVGDEFNEQEALKEVGNNPFTERGDIYIIGNHRLMCGDSTDKADFGNLMNGAIARLAVTDPPYNVDYEGLAGQIINDNQKDAEFSEFLLAAFKNMRGAMNPGSAAYIFHGESEGLNFRHAFEDSGFMLKQCLIWIKNHFVFGRQDYQWIHEPILYGWIPGAAHYFIDDYTQHTAIEDEPFNPDKMKKDELINYIKNRMIASNTSIIHEDRPMHSAEHPTMKPVRLIGRLINNSSKAGWIVLDPFGGSGSTLIACEQLRRKCYMMELDPKFCDVIVRRYYQNFPGAVIELTRAGKKTDIANLIQKAV